MDGTGVGERRCRLLRSTDGVRSAPKRQEGFGVGRLRVGCAFWKKMTTLPATLAQRLLRQREGASSITFEPAVAYFGLSLFDLIAGFPRLEADQPRHAVAHAFVDHCPRGGIRWAGVEHELFARFALLDAFTGDCREATARLLDVAHDGELGAGLCQHFGDALVTDVGAVHHVVNTLGSGLARRSVRHEGAPARSRFEQLAGLIHFRLTKGKLRLGVVFLSVTRQGYEGDIVQRERADSVAVDDLRMICGDVVQRQVEVACDSLLPEVTSTGTLNSVRTRSTDSISFWL